MAVVELDPVSALIVVDRQKALAAFPAFHPIDDDDADADADAGRLATAFRARGVAGLLLTVPDRRIPLVARGHPHLAGAIGPSGSRMTGP